jgi:hypothetical protein
MMPQPVSRNVSNNAHVSLRLVSNTLFSKGGGNSVNVDTSEKTTQSTRAKGCAEGSAERMEAEEWMRERPTQHLNVVVCILWKIEKNLHLVPQKAEAQRTF